MGFLCPFILLFVCSLVLWVACGPPAESSASPPPRACETGQSTLSASDISFSSPSDTDHSVRGLREFLLTVTLSSVAEKQELSFIVSQSAEAPAWCDVKSNPAKLTRAFTSQKSERRVYFSATNKFTENSPLLQEEHLTQIDLSQAGSTAAEVAYTRTSAPGIMVPGETYYVHAYNRGSFLKSQEVQTKDYPASSAFKEQLGTSVPTPDTNFGETGSLTMRRYLWGQQMWLDSNYAYRKVEIRTDELNLLPFRFMNPLDASVSDSDFTACMTPSDLEIQTNSRGGFFDMIRIRRIVDVTGDRAPDISLYSAIHFTKSVVAFEHSGNIAINPSDKKNQVFDWMVPILDVTEERLFRFYTDCNDAIGLPQVAFQEYQFYQIISE